MVSIVWEIYFIKRIIYLKYQKYFIHFMNYIHFVKCITNSTYIKKEG